MPLAVHPGEGEQCKVGRHWRCSFVLDDGEVSSEHLVVWWSEDSETGWFVADLGSLNGTILNDAVISAEGRVRGGDHTLRHGDTLVLASGTVIRVTMLDEETAEDAELHAGGGRPRGGLGGKGAAMLR